MIPARKCLDPHDLTARQRDLGLEVGDQFPPVAGSPQVLDDSSLGNLTHGSMMSRAIHPHLTLALGESQRYTLAPSLS